MQTFTWKRQIFNMEKAKLSMEKAKTKLHGKGKTNNIEKAKKITWKK